MLDALFKCTFCAEIRLIRTKSRTYNASGKDIPTCHRHVAAAARSTAVQSITVLILCRTYAAYSWFVRDVVADDDDNDADCVTRRWSKLNQQSLLSNERRGERKPKATPTSKCINVTCDQACTCLLLFVICVSFYHRSPTYPLSLSLFGQVTFHHVCVESIEPDCNASVICWAVDGKKERSFPCSLFNQHTCRHMFGRPGQTRATSSTLS